MDHLLKTEKEYKHLKKQGIHDIIIKINYIKIALNNDMVCGDFKDLLRRTASDKILSYIMSSQELDEELYKPIIRRF